MRIAKRHRPVARRPLFTRQDRRFLLELPLLAVIATVVPEKHWRPTCVGLERLKARLGWFSPGRIRDGLTLLRGPADADEDALKVTATRSEHHLQILREFF